MRRRHTREDNETEIAKLVSTKDKAEQQLKLRIRLGEDLSNRQISSQEEFDLLKKDYKAWNNYNEDLLKRFFTTTEISIEYERYQTRSVFAIELGHEAHWRDKWRDLQQDLTDKIDKLQDIMGRLELFEEPTAVSNGGTFDKNQSMKKLKKILNCFDKIARQLRDRYDDRNTLEIKDEYDVQDLLHALLRLEFDDIRKEEWTPSYAGSSSRMDFLLKQEQIVLEVKKTARRLKEKEIGEQLTIDIAHYQKHQNCKTLVCFVYDPESYIRNPKGLENDLVAQSTPNMLVVVVVTPE